ncbi:MAG: efflux RND transporter periplasmic adaptor subunit [Bryobacteraceae bacterium]|nr:efflux RND transporter periplasmic adaptor subunit [Bryobacteraceae bacterium]
MQSVPIFLLLCVLASFSVSCSGTKTEASGNASEKKGGGGPGGGRDIATPVLVGHAVVRDVPIQADVIGTVEPSSVVTLKPQISGQLLKAHFREGDLVKAGQLMLTIDRRSLEAQQKQLEAQILRDEAALGQAQANLARDKAQETNARNQLDRATQLNKGGIISKEQFDQYTTTVTSQEATIRADLAAIESSKAQIAASRAELENQKVQLGFTNIYAPISGRTGTLMVKPGNIVTANVTELANINQMQPVYVSFALPENNLVSLKVTRGQKLPVTASAEELGKKETGTLSFFENSVDPTTGTIRLKATFANLDLALFPGQFVRVSLQLGRTPNAVLIPNQAVQSGQDGTFVYIVRPDQKVDVRAVTVAQRVGEETVIEKGLQAGDTVVTEGTLRLVPGARVSVREPGAPAGGGQRRGSKKS